MKLHTIALIALTGSPAFATSLSFSCLTNNVAGACQSIASQLFLNVSEQPSQMVQFEFKNLGPTASSITDIFWDLGTTELFSAIVTVNSGTGTNYASSKPGSLPAGNTINFTADFMVEPASKGGKSSNGINPGEWLQVNFALNKTKTYLDVQNALMAGGTSGLRIGMHVQSIAPAGNSESLVNMVLQPPPPMLNTPEPATMAMIGGGLAALFWARRKQIGSAIRGTKTQT